MTAEQFIKDYTNHCSNELADGEFHEWLTPEQALRAVEIAKDAFMEKAWDWVEDNILSSNQQDKSLLYYEQFKKYLEE